MWYWEHLQHVWESHWWNWVQSLRSMLEMISAFSILHGIQLSTVQLRMTRWRNVMKWFRSVTLTISTTTSVYRWDNTSEEWAYEIMLSYAYHVISCNEMNTWKSCLNTFDFDWSFDQRYSNCSGEPPYRSNLLPVVLWKLLPSWYHIILQCWYFAGFHLVRVTAHTAFLCNIAMLLLSVNSIVILDLVLI